MIIKNLNEKKELRLYLAVFKHYNLMKFGTTSFNNGKRIHNIELSFKAIIDVEQSYMIEHKNPNMILQLEQEIKWRFWDFNPLSYGSHKDFTQVEGGTELLFKGCMDNIIELIEFKNNNFNSFIIHKGIERYRPAINSYKLNLKREKKPRGNILVL